jgi:hypothetical protein
MVMFRKLPILAAAAIVVAMSVAPAAAGNSPRVRNVTVDNSYSYGYGLGAAPGRVLYPDSSNVSMYGTAYVVPKSVIAYWPTYGWYRLGGNGY